MQQLNHLVKLSESNIKALEDIPFVEHLLFPQLQMKLDLG